MSNNPLFARLVLMFGPAPSDDPQAYIAELLKLTRGYATPELDKAADLLIRSHNPTHLKPWPTPSDICTACADAREMLEPDRASTSKVKDVAWTTEALQAADRLIQSDTGRAAADGGYSLGLWDFYRKQRRQPTPDELFKIKRESKEFDQVYASLNPRSDKKYLELGDSMLARRQEKADLAYGVISDRAYIAEQMLTDRSKAMAGERD